MSFIYANFKYKNRGDRKRGNRFSVTSYVKDIKQPDNSFKCFLSH